MSLPPEFGDLSDDELRQRIARLHKTVVQTDRAFQPAVEAEMNLLRGELVERLRHRHEEGETIF